MITLASVAFAVEVACPVAWPNKQVPDGPLQLMSTNVHFDPSSSAVHVRADTHGLWVEATQGVWRVIGSSVETGEIEIRGTACLVSRPPVLRAHSVEGVVDCGGACPSGLVVKGGEPFVEVDVQGRFFTHVGASRTIRVCLAETYCSDEGEWSSAGASGFQVHLSFPVGGIAATFEGTTLVAFRAGSPLSGWARVGARVVEVDGVAVQSPEDAVRRIRGPVGSPVHLTLEMDGARIERTVTRVSIVEP